MAGVVAWAALVLGAAAAGSGTASRQAAHDASCPERCRTCAAAIEAGLAWLVRTQNPNGSWGLKGGVPAYSLACGLALLAEGSSAKRGRFAREIARFRDYAAGLVGPDGALVEKPAGGTWGVALAAIALAEIERRDGTAELKPKLAALARRLAQLQVATGGWSHGAEPTPNYSQDLVAATNLAVLALRALEAAGVAVPAGVRERAAAYYARMQNPDGGFAYGVGHPMKELALSAGGRTAGAILALEWLGQRAAAARAAAFLGRHPDTLVRGKVHGVFAQHYWLAGLACRRLGGDLWRLFVERYLRPLVRAQKDDGSFALARLGARPAFGCAYWETPMALLALQLPRARFGFERPSRAEVLARAEAWLAAARQPGGVWTAKFGGEPADVLLTSLAGLALLAAGKDEDPAVAAAAQAIRARFGAIRAHWCFQYPFAMVFLAELQRRRPDPALRADLEHLVARCVKFQCAEGGWQYGDPEKLPIFSSNPATTYCVLTGLLAARGAGVAVPERVLRRGFAYLESCVADDGSVHYGPRAQFVTAAGALAAFLLAGRRDALVARVARRFAGETPHFFETWETGLPGGHHAVEFSLLFGSLAAELLGGEAAARWRAALDARLPARQRRDGAFAVERDPRQGKTPLAPLFGTVACVLALRARDHRLALLGRPARARGHAPAPPPRSRPASRRRRFSPEALAPKRWSVPGDLLPRMQRALAIGQAFFESRSKDAFLARLAGRPPDAWIEVGWATADGRFLGTYLSRTAQEIRALRRSDFENWRRGFDLRAELERRRVAPLPREIEGYGGPEERAALLAVTRALVTAAGKEEFLAAVAERCAGPTLELLFVPKAGQGATWYALPVAELRALTGPEFLVWRRRFLRWVATHTPGQSQVTRFARLSEVAFERLYRSSKAKYAGRDVERALKRLRARTGLLLARPDFAAGRTAPVVAGLDRPLPPDLAPEPGERILAVEGVPTPEWDDCIELLAGYTPGSTAALTVRGPDGKERRRLLTLVPQGAGAK